MKQTNYKEEQQPVQVNLKQADVHSNNSKKQAPTETTINREVLMPMEPLTKQYFRIFCVVSLYWFVSITMVFVNKSLLSGKKDFNAPFFVTWFQCIVTVFGCYIVYMISKIFPNLITFPKPQIAFEKCKQILPLSIVFVMMIACNNLCLQFVGVSFYYMGRSLTTVFNVLMSYLILGQKTSLAALGCCGVILSGFWLGVDQEGEGGDLSIIGVIFGVFASLFVSLNAIYTKKVMPLVNDNIWTLTFYNNINAIVLFLPLILLNSEPTSIVGASAVYTSMFWLEMIVAGIFGFAIGYVTGLQIKVTSPLTHNVSGTAKAAAQTVLATQINSEIKSWLWWTSNIVVLAGSMAYSKVKMAEMAK